MGVLIWIVLVVLAFPLSGILAGIVDGLIPMVGLARQPLMFYLGLGRIQTAFAWAAITFVLEVLAVRRFRS